MQGKLQNVQQTQATRSINLDFRGLRGTCAFAAILDDGSVIAWGFRRSIARARAAQNQLKTACIYTCM